MRRFFTLALMLLVASGFYLSTLPAEARAKHPVHRHHVVKKHKKIVHASPIRTAQRHLDNLGYYHGRIDGLMGAQTKAAIKAFQRDNDLRATGMLTQSTISALEIADKTRAMTSLPMPQPIATPSLPDFYATHHDFYGHVNQQYADPLLLAREHAPNSEEGLFQDIANRFAQLRVAEEKSEDGGNRYNITLDGQPLLLMDNQSSVIGISRTYQLAEEDAVLLTAYDPDNSSCIYQHFLLTVRSGAHAVHPVKNCTSGYQATLRNNSLWIVFPERDDGRPVGATWRYEEGDLERL